MIIRDAVREDGAPLVALLRGIGWFSAFKKETAAASQERVTRHLEMCLADDSHSLYVAENESREIVGFAAVHWLPYLILVAPEGFLSELFVAEAARGQGVGKALLDTVGQAAIRRGCVRLSLLNGRHRDSYLRQFYIKQGWEERPDMANFVRYL